MVFTFGSPRRIEIAISLAATFLFDEQTLLNQARDLRVHSADRALHILIDIGRIAPAMLPEVGVLGCTTTVLLKTV
jgi:hypothetical protein